ncbi:MAG: hypothetical protein PHU43_07940, partial [Candidatus Bipolaricaulis sp.]|nr:hypothetical protein [Candidatus Bipolaricaulis sp.]
MRISAGGERPHRIHRGPKPRPWYRFRRLALVGAAIALLVLIPGCLEFLSGLPTAPKGVRASNGDVVDKVVISWSRSRRADGYNVLRSPNEPAAIRSNSDSYQRLGATDDRTFEDETALPGISYKYCVEAYNERGVSPRSEAVVGRAGLPPVPVSAPSEIEATDGRYTDRIGLSWNAVSGATSYSVYRSGSPGGVFSYLATVTGMSWEDTQLAEDTHYWYTVAACTDGGCSSPSAADEGHTGLGVLGVPRDVSASDGKHPDRIVVSWSAVSGAHSYKVYRAATSGATYSYQATVTLTSWQDAGLAGNSHYWYRVKACRNASCGAQSLADEGSTGSPSAPITPTSPASVAASDGTYTDRIAVSWSAVGAADSYRVYRAASSDGDYAYQATVTTTSWENISLGNDSHYWYRVEACNAVGCSPKSSPDAGYTRSPEGHNAPAAPAGVAASDGAHADQIAVSWRAVSGATSYRVHRATSSGGAYTHRATVTTTSWQDTGLASDSHYWYRIEACNTVGCSPKSSADAGYTGPPGRAGVPATPTGIAASDGTHVDQIAVSWGAVSGATSYRVYRAAMAEGTSAYQATVTTTTGQDTNLASDSNYWYEVEACNNAG